ncbi:hypothetical protein COL26b_010207 [Colletotrichum chrysophilum]|uniref:uncharacterized protein n=1 Tax=Colletotrichum chrysophilum TaxID=1836956 RepID=UPI002300EB1E|nr:uncharacterized protein COL26b_010207 [Colletotrichum chrysophilum]KAJ0370104.1 hypothetical protein COL26b_010207 [Colletotrichum chrysophilum]
MDSTSFSSKTMVETTSTASETQTTSSINSKDSIVSTGPESSSTTAKTGTTSSSDNESKSASSTNSERSADATSSSTGRRGKEGPAITDTTSGSEITSFTLSTSRDRFKLPVITSEFTTTITKPGSTTTYTNEVTIHVPSTFTSTGKTTIPGTQGVTTYTDVRTTSVPRTITRSGVTSFAHVTIIPVKPTMTSIQTINDEKTVSEVVETSFEPTEITYTSTSAFTVPPRTSDVTSVIVSAVPSTVASVVTSTSPPQVYVSVGTTEITKFITAPGGNRGNEPQTQPPVFQVITSVYDGKVETFVDKGTPQTMVKSDGGVYTVAFTPPLQTIVTHEGGQATQMVITVTPSPEVAFVAVPTTKDGAGAFKEMATTINGKATVVDVPVTQEPVLLAVQTIIDGTPTVLWINSVPTAGFSPISLTLVSEIGGITGVFTTIDPLETTKTTIDDSPDRVITEIEKFGFTNGDYFVGKFLPIILAVMIAVPLRIIDLNAKLYQPFHALAQKGGIAIISPYYNMGRRSQPPEKSILLTRPTNGFYGLYAAILESNIILMLAAFMSILAEFLPILFANVPYNLTQTLKSHNVCATISLTILALMLASMVASLFIKWPELPVDPRSIAGALYYVAESRMLEDFEGLSKLDSEEREKKVKELGRRYFYGGLTGSNGKRMGVESVESVEDTAYTGGHWFLPPQEDQQGDEDNRGGEVQQSESPHQPEQTLRLERRKEVNQGEDIDRGAVLPERARPLEAKQGSEGFS